MDGQTQTYRWMLQGLTLGYGVHNLRLCYAMIMFQNIEWFPPVVAEIKMFKKTLS